MATPKLPYAEAFYPLLKSIHKALYECCLFCKDSSIEELSAELPQILDCFKEFNNFYKKGINKHISKGLSSTAQNRYGIFSRLAHLTVLLYVEAQSKNKKQKSKGLVIPSPLNILHMALTVPHEQQSSAYSFVLCRSMLFYCMGLHPENKQFKYNDTQFDFFDENNIIDSVSSFKRYINIQARWPDLREEKQKNGITSKINFLVGHFLSMKGYSHLWFKDDANLERFISISDIKDDSSWFIETYKNPTCRFRLSESYSDLPESGEIINALFGIPIPFRGGEILFHGGLKRTSKNGVVINLSGEAGVGKTSIALSLAALLSPFNTETIYITLEEDPEDLYKRLLTLIPEYLKELSIYKKAEGLEKTDWFSAIKVGDGINLEILTELIDLIKKDLESKTTSISSGEIFIPSIAPLYVVIDNLNEVTAGYADNQIDFSKISDFINSCRELGAIVMLISSEEVSQRISINYLVDITIHARQIGTENSYIKPNRIFELRKTRHQISRQGSHIFHLTGGNGFRVCPQIPSQMDKKENQKKLLSNKTVCITTLNVLESSKSGIEYIPYLLIFPNSQILLHGQGSSGKAGLGLKILLTPPINRPSHYNKIDEEIEYFKEKILNDDFSKSKFQRKVLVISFLYPQEYYSELITQRINPSLSRIYKNLINPKFKLLTFFPGYLTAEDFVNKIIRNLDEAILEGEPFTGVMLDGLHNVFLQFKNLQDNDMVWPLLYSILSRYKVTVVSTFTNFKINNLIDSNSSSIEDQKLMQKGQTPLLHSMVKASDFYISLDEITELGNTKYQISIRSAMDQILPNYSLEWDRRTLSIKSKLPSHLTLAVKK